MGLAELQPRDPSPAVGAEGSSGPRTLASPHLATPRHTSPLRRPAADLITDGKKKEQLSAQM